MVYWRPLPSLLENLQHRVDRVSLGVADFLVFSDVAGAALPAHVFGGSRGPRPSADGLVSVTGLAMAGYSNPRLAWLLLKNQKTI